MGFDGLGIGDYFLIVVRWTHAVAATAWIGGSIFFAVILRPLSAAHPEAMQRVMTPLAGIYRDLVDTSILALLISGIILSVDRLTDERTTATYGVVLGVKIAIALWMFYLVWGLRRSGFTPRESGLRKRLSWLLGYNALAAMGVAVFLMVELLRALVEQALRTPA